MTSKNGVITDHMVMSDQPILGDWMIKVTQGVSFFSFFFFLVLQKTLLCQAYRIYVTEMAPRLTYFHMLNCHTGYIFLKKLSCLF